MSYQAYLDTIKEKTGKTPEDFRLLAAKKGLADRAGLMAWLKKEYGLGYGHAHLISHLILHHGEAKATPNDRLAKLFSGKKAQWRKAYEGLVGKISKFGKDVEIKPNETYINLTRGGKKFGILQPSSAECFDIGIKLKGKETEGRFEKAGTWNTMVTHRVSITNPKQINAEILVWLKEAYDKILEKNL
jgi:hypothetical protein